MSNQPRSRKKRTPEPHVRLSKPKTSVVFDSYWRFAFERHEVYHRRVAGLSGPWTSDPIIAQYRFTNAFRAADRVSQYLIRHVIYEGDQSPLEVFFRTLLLKLFNKISTWESLGAEVGIPTVESFDVRRYERILTRDRSNGQAIYSAAYIIPSPGLGEKWKHSNHLRLLKAMLVERLPERIAEAPSLAAVYGLLLEYPSIGPFLAYQFTIDLNYAPFVNFSEMDFVVPGPGAKDGIRKCFTTLGDYSATDAIRLVTDNQAAEFEERGLAFDGLWGRPLQLIDCQNLFCEVDKYARVAHPDVLGISGRTRIKQAFRPQGAVELPMFPPKWGVTPRVKRPSQQLANCKMTGQGNLAF